jgi:outer membrane lipoprotein SlyB
MFSKGTLWAGAISGGITQIKGSREYTSGKINANEYVAHTTTNVSETIGLMAGLEYGAILGASLIPGVGSIIGTILGGILGDRLGNVVGTQVGNVFINHEMLGGNVQKLRNS